MEEALKSSIDLSRFEDFLLSNLPSPEIEGPKGCDRLREAMAYTIKSGGKRFRPALALLTAKTLNCPEENVFPVAAAVEWVHSYSLIHDDLPCMDDDDERRGQASNHKVFGEAIALLAGDALLTESFGFLARKYKDRPQVGLQIVSEFSHLCGINGMVGGQAVDIDKDATEKAHWISYIHEKKTAALIQASVVCSAMACEVGPRELSELKAFSGQLGLAFQLADDLLDWDPKHPEPTSFVNVAGPEETTKLLNEASDQCLTHLQQVNLSTEYFEPLVRYNRERQL